MRAIARQILLHLGAGFGIAAIFLGALLATDEALARLLLGAAEAPLPLLLLWLFTGLTFAMAQFALGLGGRPDADARGLGAAVGPWAAPRGALRPVPALARRRVPPRR